MCGRYALFGPTSHWRQRFGVDAPRWQDRYNVAPDQGSPTRATPTGQVPIIRMGRAGREAALVQWWLLPYWSKERFVRYSTFNARIETVATAAAFREAFKRRRCLVPASLFYEWQDTPAGKRPWVIQPANDEYFGFAGLWDRWAHGDEVVESCTVIVSDPDPAIANVHDRAPVILAASLWDDWLDPAQQDPARLLALLHANPAVPLVRYPVTGRVSNVRNEGPDLIEPAGPEIIE